METVVPSLENVKSLSCFTSVVNKISFSHLQRVKSQCCSHGGISYSWNGFSCKNNLHSSVFVFQLWETLYFHHFRSIKKWRNSLNTGEDENQTSKRKNQCERNTFFSVFRLRSRFRCRYDQIYSNQMEMKTGSEQSEIQCDSWNTFHTDVE